MINSSFLFTSESVTEGHPDKMADQVSDAILDAFLDQDADSRCAIEALFTTGTCIIAGEASTHLGVDISNIVRRTVKRIGYDSSDDGFDGNSCGILVSIGRQSSDISIGINASANKKQGAGDQGMVFGYACDETPELMPMPIAYAHRLVRQLAAIRKNKQYAFLKPDGKSQVTVAYNNGIPIGIDTVVVSSQHNLEISAEILREVLIEEVIKKEIPPEFRMPNIKYLINPTGRFTIGGPMGDTGLTGRKIIVDTYGGIGRHGGGAFSGKDPSKMDRSAAYMGRYIAKNIVASGLAKKCEIQIAYAIGVSEPISLMIETFGTGLIPNQVLIELVKRIFPISPAELIKHLNLKRPIYEITAAYGHFGRQEQSFSWEAIDMVEKLLNGK